MVLQLHPATVDDIEALAEVNTLAFANDFFNNAVFPTGAAALQWRKNRLKILMQNPIRHFWKVIDPENDNLVVAAAAWIAPVQQDVLDEMEKGLEKITFPEGVDKEVVEASVGKLHQQKKEFAAQSPTFWYLASLATRPDYQRRGCAAMLLQWGLNQAEKDATFVYLEASPAGLPFYYRNGAREVGEVITFDGQYRHACLVIYPGGKVPEVAAS